MIRSCLLLLLVSAIATPALARIEVHGHRGARARLPENTLPAFEYALGLGVDYLELDLAVTADRQLVVSHDPTINPTICLDPNGMFIDKKPLIFSLPLAEVQKYDCGTLHNPGFPDQQRAPGARIPTLDEVFEMIENSPLPQARTVRFNIEMKSLKITPGNTVKPAEFAALVMEKLAQHGMTSRVLLESFDYRTLREARKIDPTVEISALTLNPIENLLKTARKLKATYISPLWSQLSAKEVRKLHAEGFKLVPWTPNDRKAWAKLRDIGVDAIITDDPEGLMEFLAQTR